MKYYKLDRDTKAYLKRMAVDGIKTPADIYSVNDFVVGLKDFNLWGNIAFWPLRSLQNAGSGNIVYSLGGLRMRTATHDGVWTSNGISLSSTQQISASLIDLGQDVTVLFCGAGNGTTYSSYPMIFGVQSSSTFYSNEIRFASNGGAGDAQGFHRNSSGDFLTSTAVLNGMSASTNFVFHSISSSVGGTIRIRNLRNGTSASGASPTSGTATLNRLQINGRWNAGSLDLANPMTASFCAIFLPSNINSIDLIYSFYKSTLGKGLGLP